MSLKATFADFSLKLWFNFAPSSPFYGEIINY